MNAPESLRRTSMFLFWPAILVVTWGELTPSLPHLEIHVWDKLLHFIAYFGLTALAAVALRSQRLLLYGALGLIAFGGVLEIVQGLTGRDAELLDEAANALGTLSGAAAGSALLRLVDRAPRD